MKLDKGCALFFGTKIDSKLREGLALSKPGDKKYFDGSSEEFLRIMELGDEKDKERWIGKIIKPGPAVTEVDDEIGRASCRKECPYVCRSRWSPYH